MNNILKNMLEKYEIKNTNDEINALKEVIQEIVLNALSRAGFFNEAAFYGGTALRIFYGLDRFSEDLDFALLKPNKDFDISKYFKYIENEVKSYGFNLTIESKEKNFDSNIQSAFLKGDTLNHILTFFPNDLSNDKMLKNIKIKLEVDINPPSGANYEFKYKLLPYPHQVRLYDKSSLFAGKIHAILCRNWSSRTKGRDLYDFIFYMAQEVKVNLTLVKEKLIESGKITRDSEFNINILINMLTEKFKEINYSNAKEDVKPFIKDVQTLDLWSENFFIDITKNLKAE